MSQTSVGAVVNGDCDEFGPHPISKLEVKSSQIIFAFFFIIKSYKSFFLQIDGITNDDIKNLQASGYHTIDSLMFVPKKTLL